MKKLLLNFTIAICICFFFSCSNILNNSDSGSNTNNNPTNNPPKISSQYWGTWIQMDTGNEYYIDGQNVYKKNSNSKTKIQSGINGYILESPEVLKNGSTVFFRKGGKNRSFSVTVSGFSTNRSINNSSRAAGTGNQGVSGRRENQENSDDTETVNSDDDNSLDFEGGVADDPQTVTVIDGEDNGTATVDPQYDGENVGSIPIVESGKYAFKTTYKVSNADAQGFMYGNNLGVYNISFNLTNIGQATCETSVYSISWSDTNLSSTDLVKDGNFTSIAPGSAKVISGTFIYGYFDEEYKDVTITISITDSKYGKTWNDYVSLRFYRGWVNYKVNARNFNQSSTAKLNGFLVYPDGRSKRFTVSSGNSTIVSVPWSSKDYYFVLSGANNDTEMCYSFIASEYGNPADLSGVWSISDINAYEPNDTIQSAVSITNNTTPIKAYLKNGDIDYYKFNTNNLKCSKGKIEYSVNTFTDTTSITSSYNNDDGSINPGETIWMDLKIHNSSGIKLESVTLLANCDSEYLTFTSNSASYGDINAGNYQTYYYYKCGNSGGWSNSSANNFNVKNYAPLKFKISADCPIDTTIPINLKMTAINGYEWTDSFNIKVVKSGTDLEFSTYSITDTTSITSSYNNDDGSINPGETIWMDIKIHNKGTSQAKSINIEASSDSEYITFTSNSASYGDINAGNYQTYYYYKCGNSGGWSSTANNFNVKNYAPLKFKISSDCPIDTTIPINLKMTDVNGYEWSYSFNITIVKENVNIEFTKYQLGSYEYSVIKKDTTRNITIFLKNKGTSTGKDIVVTLDTTYPYIEFTNNSMEFGDISSGETKSKVFTIKATEDFPRTNTFSINLNVKDKLGNEWDDTFIVSE